MRQDLVWALGIEKASSTGDIYKVEVVVRGDVVMSVSWTVLEDAPPKDREIFGSL